MPYAPVQILDESLQIWAFAHNHDVINFTVQLPDFYYSGLWNLEPTHTPNALFPKNLTEVLCKMQPELEIVVFYQHEFQNHANGVGVVKMTSLKYHACQQK